MDSLSHFVFSHPMFQRFISTDVCFSFHKYQRFISTTSIVTNEYRTPPASRLSVVEDTLRTTNENVASGA